MPTRPGIYTSHDVTLTAIDGSTAPRSVVLVGVQGDPSFGDEMADQRESVDVFERGLQIGAVLGDEAPIELSWTALDCDEAREFMDFVLFRPKTGGTPTSTDSTGGKAMKLRVAISPASGTPRIIEYARTYWKATASGGIPATIALSCRAFGRTEP
jgi:hypothetical protein